MSVANFFCHLSIVYHRSIGVAFVQFFSINPNTKQTTNFLKSSLSTFRNCLKRYKDPGKLIRSFSKTSLEISTQEPLVTRKGNWATKRDHYRWVSKSPARLTENKRTRKLMNLLLEVLFGGLELPKGAGLFSTSSQAAHHSRFLLRHHQELEL